MLPSQAMRLRSIPRNIVDVIGVTVNNAYSFRKVRNAYGGSAIRVRRSSDNTEQDIGFTPAGDFDYSALLTFVGANNGFVTKFYDQSGNGNDLSQTTQANQPQIVSSGAVIELITGRPTMQFDGSNDILIPSGNATISQPFTRCGVFKFLAITSGKDIYSDAANNSLAWSASGTVATYAGAQVTVKSGVSANDKASVIERFNVGPGSAYYNGIDAGAISPGSNSSLRRCIGGSWNGSSAATWTNMTCSEHIIWASLLSDSNTVKLYANQMAYWQVP